MESGSQGTVYGGRPKKSMIQFDISDHVDPAIAEVSIGDDICKGRRGLEEKLSDESTTEAGNQKEEKM